MAERTRVLLIGWDAADWKVINPLMDAGRMPNLERLVSQGSIAQIATLNPPFSPMLWTSIATGKRPFKHGIHGFAEPTPDGRHVQPVSNLSRKCKALWNILSQNALRSIVVGWWPSHPAEPIDGVTVSDHFHRAYGPLEKGWPILAGSVHPPALAETLAEFRLHPDEVAGEMIEPFVPKAREIDQDRDRRLAGLTKTLCDCVSVHGVATWLMENEPWDFFAVYYDAIDHFCHGFMRYHPPRQPHIPERDFDLYQNVVSAAYCFHDQMLGTLLAKAGPDVRVILMSDHGFHPDHLRPKTIPHIPAGPAIEHREFGILAVAGPGLKRDELLHGASVLDIAPTVLAMFGLPVAEDMDGKVLAGAFEQPPRVETITSWEEVDGRDGRHPPHTRLDPEASREVLEQLVALGYIEKPDQNSDKAVADTIAELRYNLGQSYQDAGRHGEALEIFRELYRANPLEQRYGVHLFASCQAMGLVEEMRAIVEYLDGPRRALFLEARDRATQLSAMAAQRAEEAAKRQAEAEPVGGRAAQMPGSLLQGEEEKELVRLQKMLNFQLPVVDYLKAQVLIATRQWAQALDCLAGIQAANLARPGLFLETAHLYQRMRQWDEAEKMYAKALMVDPDNPHAHIGMCRMALHRNDARAAVESALEGLQRLYHNPVGHFLLGVSLARLGYYQRSRQAFEAALLLNPNYRQAHLRLAWLLKSRLNDPIGAAEHLRMFRELRNGTSVPAAEPMKTRGEKEAVSGRLQDSSWSEDAAGAGEGTDMPPLTEREMVVVSGLPRSGTSMIMQMLAAGGMGVLTDGVRRPDEDNPRGYFESERVKQLGRNAGLDSTWLEEARGKAVKIVAPLLLDLPEGGSYRVLFIDRNLDDILASQRKMLERKGGAGETKPEREARLREHYGRILLQVKKELEQRRDVRVLRLHMDRILMDRQGAAETINRFLGGTLHVAAMAASVAPELHRQRC